MSKSSSTTFLDFVKVVVFIYMLIHILKLLWAANYIKMVLYILSDNKCPSLSVSV